jgi:hypothetical protein
MAFPVAEQAGVRVRREVTAVEVQGESNLGLVGIAGKCGPSGRLRSSHDVLLYVSLF